MEGGRRGHARAARGRARTSRADAGRAETGRAGTGRIGIALLAVAVIGTAVFLGFRCQQDLSSPTSATRSTGPSAATPLLAPEHTAPPAGRAVPAVDPSTPAPPTEPLGALPEPIADPVPDLPPTEPPPPAAPGVALPLPSPSARPTEPPRPPVAPPSPPAAEGPHDISVAALGVRLTLPDGWRATWDARRRILDVEHAGRRFFVEPLGAEDADMGSLASLVSMVEGFGDEGDEVTIEARGRIDNGYFVRATLSNGEDPPEPHFFLVKVLGKRKLACRLGPGATFGDIATVQSVCSGLTTL